MRTWTHGGDWAGFAACYGALPLDFSANVSPLGLPPAVAEAARTAVGEAARYPDPACRALRLGLSKAEGVAPDGILCGNGAADLIYRAVLARRPRRALVTAPAFSEYEAALGVVNCEVERYALLPERDFRLDADVLSAIRPGLDLVFLCQPNNPTGVTTSRDLLLAVLERCRDVGAVLVLDECFCGFLDHPAAHSLTDQLEHYPNLLILKAFTKLYALAGLRLGYALCADAAFLADMARCGPPWAVSCAAQAAGLAALNETEYAAAVRALVGRERPPLADGLRALGLRVVPGEANFLLFQSPKPLDGALAARGILLRRCGSFPGLDDSWYRAAVRTGAENQILLSALAEILT